MLLRIHSRSSRFCDKLGSSPRTLTSAVRCVARGSGVQATMAEPPNSLLWFRKVRGQDSAMSTAPAVLPALRARLHNGGETNCPLPTTRDHWGANNQCMNLIANSSWTLAGPALARQPGTAGGLRWGGAHVPRLLSGSLVHLLGQVRLLPAERLLQHTCFYLHHWC